MYAKFGLPFDHVYAFEITRIEPEKVYQKIDKLMAAYH
jgi:hypothetical protein